MASKHYRVIASYRKGAGWEVLAFVSTYTCLIATQLSFRDAREKVKAVRMLLQRVVDSVRDEKKGGKKKGGKKKGAWAGQR